MRRSLLSIALAVSVLLAGATPSADVIGNRLTDGLVAAWHFGLGVTEVRSQGYAGTFGGAAKLAARPAFGQLLVMEGSGDRWDLNIPAFMQVGQPVTIVAFGRFNTPGTTANRVGTFRNGSSYAYGLQAGGAVLHNWNIGWSAGTTQTLFNTGVDNNLLFEGQVAARFCADYRDFWMNGKRLAVTTTGAPFANPTYSGTPTMIFGSSVVGNVDIEYFLLYRRILEPSELILLAQQPYAWLENSALPDLLMRGAPASLPFSPFKVGD